ncbi:acyl-ACP--UDP-N-acetylglucosamine O-acyltransferase [soil metagenome]
MIASNAIIDPSARIAEGVTIGPWSIIGADVEIGADTYIGPHVVINGPTLIGKANKIFQFSSIGDAPQDKRYAGEKTRLEIGNNNVIREFCTISRGTTNGGGITRIGDNNFLMAYVHIGHDCVIGNSAIFANNASLSGHVLVEDYVMVGGFAGVHQFCTLGAHSFITKAALVPKDVLPYLIVAGPDAKAFGLNKVGLKRRGFNATTMEHLRQAYKIVFRRGLTVAQALIKLEELSLICPEVRLMMMGLQRSSRGIVR